MKFLLIIAAVGLLIAALVMLVRRSGPRITTIEHRRDEDERPKEDL
ncbi:MAG: hypothetical protein M3Q83_01190 [Pseudomonadota bacterium]|nr:hypothetical protein [Pseudomonadota bacterium]